MRLSLALGVLAACGGANLNQRAPGNHDGGIALGNGEIAVDPSGKRIVIRTRTELHAGDLATLTMARIATIDDPKLLAFHAAGFFVFTRTGELVSYDLERDVQLWRRAPGLRGDRLDVTPDGTRVLLTGHDVVSVFDAATGDDAGSFTAPRGIEDVDVTPDSRRIIVTERQHAVDSQPFTDIHVVAATGEKLCTATVPNCADELIVDAEGARAYLAPTGCSRDPVSIIDITATCKFEKNLPGFGPIALTPDGATGVAFLDRDDRDPNAPAKPPGLAGSRLRYHLMLFDTRTHALQTIPIGDQLPRYALTPDGQTLVVDGLEDAVGDGKQVSLRSQPIRLVDLASRRVREADGPRVMLNAFVVTPDSRQIWLIHGDAFVLEKQEVRALDVGLFAVDVPGARIERIPLTVAPEGINALPGVTTLLLRDGSQIHLFDVASRRITGTVRAP